MTVTGSTEKIPLFDDLRPEDLEAVREAQRQLGYELIAERKPNGLYRTWIVWRPEPPVHPTPALGLSMSRRDRMFPFLKRPTPVLDALGTRGARYGLLGAGYGMRSSIYGVDGSLDAMKAQKTAEWKNRGYSDGMISMALELADEWTHSMSVTFAPPAAQEEAMRMNYPKGLEVADRWISKMAR